MSIENWSIQVSKQVSENEKDKISQFGLVPLYGELSKDDGFDDLRENFLRLGIWSLYNPGPIFKAIKDKQPFSVLIGMRPAQNLHLGHLTLMNEVSWLQSKGGQPIFVFASYEAGKVVDQKELQRNAELFSESYTRFTESTLPKKTVFLSDKEDRDIRLLEDRVSEHLRLNKILQLYGWNDQISLADIRVVSMTVAAFLYPSILYSERPAIILSDINQVTHAEMTKIVSRKLNLPSSTYSYRMLLPSLEGTGRRMSIKDPKSIVFLTENQDQVSQKMMKSLSGGRKTIEEQRLLGGDPLRCSFFKIANTLIAHQESTNAYNECVSGSVSCRECKLKHLPEIVKKFSRPESD